MFTRAALEISAAKNKLSCDSYHRMGKKGYAGRIRKGKTQRDLENKQALKAVSNRDANGRYTLACRSISHIATIPTRDGIRNNGKKTRCLKRHKRS